MKINKVSEINSNPSWLGNNDDKKLSVSKEVYNRIKTLASSSVGIIEERSYIEECAEKKENYLYNSKWTDDTKRHLKEYALACNLESDKIKEVDADFMLSQISELEDKMDKEASNSSKMVKIASGEATLTMDDIAKEMISDPFKLSDVKERSNKSSWQSVSNQSILKDAPSVLSSSVRAIRADESYFKNIDTKVARGTNSIVDPSAIEKLSKSEQKGTAEILKAQKEDRIKEKSTQYKEWQESIIKAAGDLSIIPKGKVFKTEDCAIKKECGSENKSKLGSQSMLDPASIADQTDGEKISKYNKEKREANKYEFVVRKQSQSGISKEFGDSLQNTLNK